MTQAEINREVSRITGETMPEVERRGFTILEPLPEEPIVIDWDAQHEPRIIRFPKRRRRRQLAAA